MSTRFLRGLSSRISRLRSVRQEPDAAAGTGLKGSAETLFGATGKNKQFRANLWAGGVKIAGNVAEYKDKHPFKTRMPKNKSGWNSTRSIMCHPYSKAYVKARRARGFTIIETIATLFTLVVGILPMVSLLLASRALGQQAQMQAAAYSLGRQQMATLLSPSYGNRLAVSQASFAIPSTLTSQFPNAAFTGDYTLNTYSPAGQVPAEQQIIVRIRWTNPASQGTASSIELDTISAQGAGR